MFYTNICTNFWTELNFREVPLQRDCTMESLKSNYYIPNHTIFYKLL